MKFFSFLSNRDEIQIGAEFQNNHYNMTQALSMYQKARGIQNPIPIQFLQVLVEMGNCSGDLIESVFTDSWVMSKSSSLILDESIRFDVPISRPSKIICLGRNYAAHAKELDHELPKEPIFFSKATSSLLQHDGEIRIPSWIEGRVDPEAELAVIIGKSGFSISEEEALDYVAGYSILNDVTAREMQKGDIQKGMPWFRSKSIDTFCPMGPYLVPRDQIPDPQQLDITLTVGGEKRQKAGTRDMIFPVRKAIASISRYMTLQAGDIIATGTPEGVSPILPGDKIEIQITGLGTLTNPVVSA